MWNNGNVPRELPKDQTKVGGLSNWQQAGIYIGTSVIVGACHQLLSEPYLQVPEGIQFYIDL